MKPRLVISELLARDFREAMLAQRISDEESLGFWFCQSRSNDAGEQWEVKDVWVPGADELELHARHGVTLAAEGHLRLVKELKAGRLLVHVHTHPGFHRPNFSSIDDAFEKRFTLFLENLGVDDQRYLSGVFNQDMTRKRFRLWSADDLSEQPAVSLTVIPEAPEEVPSQLLRQKQFGDAFRRKLAGLRVGLVGCGGLGAVLAEQLGRLGVRNWVLVDEDRLSLHNLNRMPAATQAMVKRSWSKTAYVAWLLRRSGLQPDIRQHRRMLKPGGDTALKDCDLILAATDSDSSRLAAQEAAQSAGARLISLGVFVDASPKGIRSFARVVMPPMDHSWCLACSGAISVEQATREELVGELRDQLRANGYLEGVPAPAVYWLNSLCVSVAVSLVHRLMLKQDGDLGLDWLLQPELGRWREISHENAGCLYCEPAGEQSRYTKAQIDSGADPLFCVTD